MDSLINNLSSYSIKKLKDILIQAEAYNEDYIDYVKDELIKRGEEIVFNQALFEEIKALSDNELRTCVEDEWPEYHLEYMEVARKEYLKRGFKNIQLMPVESSKKYPALRIVSSLYYYSAWVVGLFAIIYSLYCFSRGSVIDTEDGFFALIYGFISLIGMLAISELIKVILDIEWNTRKVK
jgi:DNA-dependent RNA polymerase auxiliary subunit epsilon